jgi:microsomal dipeptidase-like Zn-dependent dipeptidase
MRFFDAHCDTIGPLLESGADFLTEPGERAAAGARGALVPHVTLPGLKAGGIGAQVFASWVWSGKYKGREFETGMAKVEAVRNLCADHPDDLFLAASGADLAAPFGSAGGGPTAAAPPAGPDVAATGAGDRRPRIAILPSLEGADPLGTDVDNLFAFYEAGVRLVTLAWGDNAFCGSSYGEGTGLTKKGVDLVAAMESLGVVVDVSHLSDRGFADLCQVAERPFVASHSNCRSLCPSGRNLTDEMIHALGERGGVMGITLAPGFLSKEYWDEEQAVMGRSFRTVLSGEVAFEAAQVKGAEAMAGVRRPPLASLVDHVKWAINKGGEDAVGLGGDLDGVDYLPEGFAGVEDYPLIEELLRESGLSSGQVDKICHQNFLRVFQEVLG